MAGSVGERGKRRSSLSQTVAAVMLLRSQFVHYSTCHNPTGPYVCALIMFVWDFSFNDISTADGQDLDYIVMCRMQACTIPRTPLGARAALKAREPEAVRSELPAPNALRQSRHGTPL